jgi:hypothetical protein
MYIDINTLFTFEVSKSDDQSILAAIVCYYRYSQNTNFDISAYLSLRRFVVAPICLCAELSLRRFVVAPNRHTMNCRALIWQRRFVVEPPYLHSCLFTYDTYR